MSEPKNETALCAGAVAFLSERRRETIRPIERPDVEERQREAVELVAEGPSGRFVFEHTRIESFPNQIADGKAFILLLEPLETDLVGSLPPGTYELIIPPGAASQLRRNDFGPVRTAIAEWAVSRGRTLALGPDDDDNPDAPWSISERPANVPFDVTLQRTPPDNRVVVFVARFSPPTLEKARRARIETALERKCPKLAAAKRAHRATSVLILESDDVALANRHAVSASVIEEVERRQDEPDIILLVETDRGLAWQLWIVKESRSKYPNIEEPGPFEVRFKAEESSAEEP